MAKAVPAWQFIQAEAASRFGLIQVLARREGGMSVLVSLAVTPLIVYLWSRAFPVLSSSEFAAVEYGDLKKRNGWIDLIVTLMMFVGLVLPFLLMPLVRRDHAMWLVGVAVGSMVILRIAWVCVATWPSEPQR